MWNNIDVYPPPSGTEDIEWGVPIPKGVAKNLNIMAFKAIGYPDSETFAPESTIHTVLNAGWDSIIGGPLWII